MQGTLICGALAFGTAPCRSAGLRVRDFCPEAGAAGHHDSSARGVAGPPAETPQHRAAGPSATKLYRDGGVDSAFSMEPEEFAALRVETERAWLSLGAVTYGGTKAEQNSRAFRRSLYLAEDVPAGAVLTDQNLRIVRPGFGLPPKHYEAVLGRRLKSATSKGTPISWDILY